MAAELDAHVERPYDARVVRKDPLLWSAGARAIRSGDTIAFPAGLPASSLELVRTPEGEVQARADGDEIDAAVSPLFVEAVEELERRGRARFESFYARADKDVGGSWQLTIDPL